VHVTSGLLPFAPSGSACGCSRLFRTIWSTTRTSLQNSFVLQQSINPKAHAACTLLRASCPSPLRGQPAAAPDCSRQSGQLLGHLSRTLSYFSNLSTRRRTLRARYFGPPALRPFGVSLRLLQIVPDNLVNHSDISPELFRTSAIYQPQGVRCVRLRVSCPSRPFGIRVRKVIPVSLVTQPKILV